MSKILKTRELFKNIREKREQNMAEKELTIPEHLQELANKKSTLIEETYEKLNPGTQSVDIQLSNEYSYDFYLIDNNSNVKKNTFFNLKNKFVELNFKANLTNGYTAKNVSSTNTSTLTFETNSMYDIAEIHIIKTKLIQN